MAQIRYDTIMNRVMEDPQVDSEAAARADINAISNRAAGDAVRGVATARGRRRRCVASGASR
jgi:hypothetical protein